MRNLNTVYFDSYYRSLESRGWRAQILCSAIIAEIQPLTIIDVGCGHGELIKYIEKEFKFDVWGLEATPRAVANVNFDKRKVMLWDLRVAIPRVIKRDLAICFNVAEHIDVGCEEIFISNLVKMGKMVLFAAVEEFGGDSDKIVNLRPHDFWRELFLKQGMIERKEIAEKIRDNVGNWRRKPVMKMVVDNLICMEEGNDRYLHDGSNPTGDTGKDTAVVPKEPISG